MKPGKLYTFKQSNPSLNTGIEDVIFGIVNSNQNYKAEFGAFVVFVKNEWGQFFEHAHFILPNGLIGRMTIMYMQELSIRCGIHLYEVKK